MQKSKSQKDFDGHAFIDILSLVFSASPIRRTISNEFRYGARTLTTRLRRGLLECLSELNLRWSSHGYFIIIGSVLFEN